MYETITRYHRLGSSEFVLVPIGPFKISGKFCLKKTKNDPEKQLEDSEGYNRHEIDSPILTRAAVIGFDVTQMRR